MKSINLNHSLTTWKEYDKYISFAVINSTFCSQLQHTIQYCKISNIFVQYCLLLVSVHFCSKSMAFILKKCHLWTKCLLASFCSHLSDITDIPYFIEYNVHTSIVRTGIWQWFLAKKISRINSKELIIASLILKSHIKPFLSYLPCIVCREYFSIIFNVKSVHYTR